MILIRSFSTIVFGLLASCGFQAAAAESYTWRTAEIGGGGFVTGTVFHPTEPGLIYARTDVGGAYRLDPATRRWTALNDDVGGLNNEFQHLGVLTIGVDPNDADRLYIATGQYGGAESWKLPSRIYRSTDRGASWHSYVTPGFKMAGNGESRGTGERMAVDPLNGANLLVGTSDAGIWRSTDDGASWTRMTAFTPASTNFVLYAPANHLNPGPKRRVYAAANTSTAHSFWFSDDNGSTWSEVPNHPGSTAGSEMMPIQGSFDAAGVFYSTWGNATGPSNGSSRYGVWKLAANGSNWTSILPPTGQGSFSGISADPRVAGHVVVSTLHRWWPGDEIYRSTDGGTTWSAALRSGTRSPGNSPWSASPGAHWITDIDIDPFNSDRAIFNNGFGLIQTTNLSSSGAARLWTFFSDGLEETVPLGLLSPTAGPPLISVIGDYTGFRHDDLNRSPLRGSLIPGSGSTNVITGADLAPAKIIRQNGGTTLYSQDAAATSAAFPTTPAPIINGHNRVILSTDGLRLLWCPPNSPAYVSNDNGATWNISTTGHSIINTNGTQTVSILAGAAGVPGTTNATGGEARFNTPSAIALDSSGVRYIADTANHLIRRIVAGGGVNTMAGEAGVSGSTNATGTAARFNSPAGIVVDASKNVFVADTANHTIRKITAAGVVTTLAGSPGLTGSTNATGSAARFNSPTGLAVDSSGNLYVCDTGNHSIRKITTAGVVTAIAGSPGVSGTTNGTGSTARFNAPNGITLDSGGDIFVADSENHAIRRITLAGEVTTFAGLAGTSGSTDATGGAARFNTPKSITLDASGTFHVADSGNHTIRKITSAAAVTTVAGLSGNPGTAGGAGTTARFNNPSSIAATPDGLNFYIADTASHIIRRNTLYNTLIPLADRVDGNRFYLWDSTQKRMLTSSDGGASFSVIATGVNSAFARFRTVPGHNGHIWARAGGSGIYRSTNFGATFTKLAAVAEVYQFDFGKAAPAAAHPAVFIWGKVGSTVGFFRSDDAGATWVRINDNLHNFGYQNDIAGDPRVYGRVYLATSGRGVVYGDFANPATSEPGPPQVLYDDALQNGWTNASPGGSSLTSLNPVYRGGAAISVPAGFGKGVSLTCSRRSLGGLESLIFWIHGGALVPPPLQIGVSRGGIALEAVPVTVPAIIGWQRIAIPLSQLGIANIEDLTGLRIESRTINSVTPGAFSLDDISLDDPTEVTITLSNLNATCDGTPKPVTVTTIPAGVPVTVTYNGSTSVPIASGNYEVSAVPSDPVFTGSATGTLVIARRSFSDPVTGWLATNTAVIAGANTASPLLNSGNGSGTSGASIPFFARITPRVLSTVGDSLSMRGNVTVNTPAGVANQVLWFRFGLFDNPNAVGSKTVNNWLGYTAMAQSTAANSLYERIGGTTSGDFASSIFGTSGRTPDASPAYLGANSPSGVVTLSFDQIITRTATGVTVVSRLGPPGTGGAADTVYLSSTYTDTTPNNNGFSNGVNQTIPTDPVHNPRFDSVGFVFSGAYINSTNTSSAQFADVAVTYTPGTDALPQTIDFPPLADQAFSTAPLTLTATANSGLPVSYSVVNGPANVNGSALTLTGVGEVTVRASQAGDVSYLPALPVERSFTIGKAPASVTLSSLSHTYNGFAKSAVVTTNPPNLTVEMLYNGEQNAPYQIGNHEVTAMIREDHYEGSASGILVISLARTDLENWRFEHFETYDDASSAANSADPDFDGIQNLMEFALGLDPEIPSILPASLVINGSQMEYIYTRSKAALATLSFIVERTDSLSAGSWITEPVSEIFPPLLDNGVLQTVKVVFPMGGERGFVRLRVIVQP